MRQVTPLARIVAAILGFCVMMCKSSPVMSNRRPPMQRQNAQPMTAFMLPSNATSIRADISEGFSCENRAYGYYADVANECQIFHVCLPVMFEKRNARTYHWSFICPEDTLFSQDSFTCMRSEDMAIRCDESEKFYDLNNNFGGMMPEDEDMGQFRDATTTTRADFTTVVTTTMIDENPMTTEEEEDTSTEMSTLAMMEAEPTRPPNEQNDSVVKTIESIIEKAARDLARDNSTTPLTRTKRKGQRRRFLFTADA
ncbi:hypothetical protein DMENIID0001_157640 [Sergentomyia squamirostris]